MFPDLLEIKPGMKQTATAIDMDVAYEIGRLERQLQVSHPPPPHTSALVSRSIPLPAACPSCCPDGHG